MSESSSAGPISSANNLALEILQALGIPSRRAVSVTLVCDAGDVARLRVEYLVDTAFPGADLMAKLAATCKSFGELITEYSGDLADGKVTGTELRRIEREGGELIADVHALMTHAADLVERAKPPALRPVREGRQA